ncbi:MAG: Hemagluttinin family protein [Candidatus Amesbacteria bacterium GW2011_GWB1_47_26]|nr:MAG: Hemagluttinin family protein [Candidatus Amesbacteria bacterium GW2011_GWB1_47_26]
MYTVAQAAQILGVAAVTLRLWERQGKITSNRTIGGQRRYSEEDIQRIRNLINLPRIQSPATPPVPRPKPHLTLPQKRVLLGTAAALIISAAGFVAAKSDLLSNITPFNPPLKLREGVGGELWSFFQRPSSASIALSDSIRGTVLASQTRFEDLLFKVNIPAEFARDIKAPNILYGLKAGDGIDISAGQTPTISTNLQTFKTVKVGGTNISAGSKADTLELAAGSNVTLSTSDKKITIAASATDVTTSGWTDDGTILRLTTVGDIVAIGAASGAAKLNINADDLRDLITASQAGSLKFRLTNAGIIDTGTWNGSVIGPAYGGTGIANNAASTLTLSGNYATTLTLTGTTGITLPTSGTLYGTATDSITSSQLLTSLSDETGTGVAVFGTSPTITTSITTPSTTFALVNTTATTVNFAGAATSLNLGAATGTTTINNAASISGALTLFGTPTLQGTALQTLTLGGTTTGNIVIDSGSSVINLPDLTASRAVFTDSSSNLSSTAASAALLNSLSDETGTGVAVFGTSPTLTTPVISQIVNTGTLTLPTSTDTLVGRATTDTLTNKTWNGNTIGAIYGGTGQSTWTTGDLLYASGTNALSKLGIGSDGQALTVSSGVPIWAGGSGSGTVGWWQRNLGVLAPTNITDDLAVGGTATSSAKFQIFGASGNATTSGTLTFNAGNQIQTTKNETLTIGGSTTGNIVLADSISGDITFLDDVAINGGDLTTTQTTATLFNTTATTVNLAGAGTTITIGAATGTTTINNSLSVLGSFTLGDNGDTGSINTSDWDISTTGDLTGIGGITANGAIAFSPTSTSDITFTTDADSTFVVSGLSTTSGSGLCLDASNNVIICSSGSGSSLWTLSGSTIYPNLASYDALVGSITAGDGVGKFTVSGAKTGKALVVLNETGDQAIWTASASGTTVANLDRSGNLAVEGTISDLGGATLVVADDLQINEGDLLTDDTTFNLINATATTLNIGGAATTISLGASTGTTTINNSATVTGDLGVNGGDITSSATSFNLLQSTVTTLNLGGAATTLSIGASTGTTTINNANTVISGDLAVNGGDLTTTATTFNLVNATATTLNIGGAATTLSIGATTGTTTIANDLTIGNAITDAITFTGRVAADSDLIPIGTTGTNDLGSSSLPWDNLYVTGVTAAGDISFAPTGTFDVTFTTDSDSTVIFNGLATSTGSGLCLDGSNNIIVCSAGSGSSLWTLSGSTVYANSAAYNILIGSTSTSDDIGKLTVSGAKTGKALAVLNETGDQNVLEASASGVPVLSITRTGNIVFEGTTNNDFETTLSLTDPSADRTITLPNATGTVCLDSDNCTGGTAGPWGEASGVVFLDTSTNNVNVGGSANLGKLAIDGDTDEIQFLIWKIRAGLTRVGLTNQPICASAHRRQTLA